MISAKVISAFHYKIYPLFAIWNALVPLFRMERLWAMMESHQSCAALMQLSLPDSRTHNFSNLLLTGKKLSNTKEVSSCRLIKGKARLTPALPTGAFSFLPIKGRCFIALYISTRQTSMNNFCNINRL